MCWDWSAVNDERDKGPAVVCSDIETGARDGLLARIDEEEILLDRSRHSVRNNATPVQVWPPAELPGDQVRLMESWIGERPVGVILLCSNNSASMGIRGTGSRK